MALNEYQSLIVNLRTTLPDSLHFSNLLANEEYERWLLPKVEAIKKAQYWDQKEIAAVTAVRLKVLLQYAQKLSPFWRERLKAYGVDLQSSDVLHEIFKLPIVDKRQLVEWGDKVLVLNDEEPLIEYSTSGTTGVPLHVKFKEADIFVNECLYFFEPPIFEGELIEKLIHEKFILMLGRNVLPQFASFSEHSPVDSFSSLECRNTREQVYEKISRNTITCLFGFSSLVFEFMRHVREDGVRLSVITELSGEALSSEEEKFVYDTTGGPIVFDYNCKEAGKIGGKCSVNIGKNLYHVYRERVLVEIVDDKGNVVGNDTEGNIVVTVLDRITTPIIRYATGDRGQLLSEPCLCSKRSPLLKVEGRAGHFIALPSGKTFSSLTFRSLLANEIDLRLIKRYQIVQERIDKLRIDIVPAGHVSQETLATAGLILEKALHNEAVVEIRKVEDMERNESGKSRAFIPLRSHQS